MDDVPFRSMVFSLATERDIPLLRQLAERIWWAAYTDLLSPEQIGHMLGWMYSEEALTRDLEAGVRYELFNVEGQSVGYLATSFHAATRHVELHKLYLLPELQGRGFGQAMLRHAISDAIAQGAGRLQLRVNRRNHRALRAYGRAGFQITGEVCQDIGGGFVMDDLVMTRELGPEPEAGQRSADR
ncbi:MAG TPA: GNAT family N-acetyltransferase [Candidatus Limnocylindria bacterium]|jgi:ribosomal protein S18 acetylase RimI-like enzyme|nr:GNAT family N-acetyltransferase [Candidatus Limnocylindria bacterium]